LINEAGRYEILFLPVQKTVDTKDQIDDRTTKIWNYGRRE